MNKDKPFSLYPVQMTILFFAIIFMLRMIEVFVLRLDELWGEVLLSKFLGFLLIVAYLWLAHTINNATLNLVHTVTSERYNPGFMVRMGVLPFIAILRLFLIKWMAKYYQLHVLKNGMNRS